MCLLCSHDETEVTKEKRNIKHQANQLRKLADKLDELAEGRINPHEGQGIKNIDAIAHGCIRYLVSEYV